MKPRVTQPGDSAKIEWADVEIMPGYTKEDVRQRVAEYYSASAAFAYGELIDDDGTPIACLTNTTEEWPAGDDEPLRPGDLVRVVRNCEDGQDAWAIGKLGVISYSEDEDEGEGGPYSWQVYLEGDLSGTYTFSAYQLSGAKYH